jgi:hypothetical protein
MTVFTYSRNSGNKKERLCTHYQKFGKSCRPAERILQYKGLITGATYVPHKKIIALSGATANAVPIYLSLYDYNSNFFSGNKRKIKIAPVSSVEAIATKMACTTI